MARIRTIKPEFFTSEDIVELPPLARLLYIAIWCEADKEGLLAWKPKTFKMRYLPGDDCDIDAICEALVARRLVVLYGDGLACIPSFKSHQHINPREKDSGLPAPTAEDLTRGARVSDASVTRREEGRKEGKGKEGREGNLSEQSPDFADGQPEAEKSTKPRKYHGTEEDHKAARWIFEQVRKVDATAKEPTGDSWANDIRLMREIDGHTHHAICEMFGWANKDSFWCANILSPSKLREKWGQLAAKRGMAAGGQQGQKFQFGAVDRSGDARAQAATMERHGLTIPDGEVEF